MYKQSRISLYEIACHMATELGYKGKKRKEFIEHKMENVNYDSKKVGNEPRKVN